MTAHSRISASSVSRSLSCVPSIIASKGVPPYESEDAQLGKDAHELIELILKGQVDRDNCIGRVMSCGNKVDEDMLHAALVFVRFVEENCPDANERYLEQRIIDPEIPDFGGTVDCFFFGRGTRRLVIADYKHGQGVSVPAEENKQALSYASLVLSSFKRPVPDDFEVEVVIIQPRHRDEAEEGCVDGIQSWVTSAKRVREHREDIRVLYARLQSSDQVDISDSSVLTPGDHCKFCPVMSSCGVYRQQFSNVSEIMATAIATVPNVPADDIAKATALANALSIDKVVEALQLKGAVSQFLAACEQRVFAELKANPDAVSSYKIVRGRAHRRWAISDDKVVNRLANKGVSRSILRKTTLLSPAKVEKLPEIVKNDKVTPEYLAGLWERPEGKLTLVPATDPRPAYVFATPDEIFGTLPDQTSMDGVPVPSSVSSPSTSKADQVFGDAPLGVPAMSNDDFLASILG